MGERSVIEWTDATCNFWRGCDKVDPTCAHCYMFRDQRRYGRDPGTVVRCSDAIFRAPLKARWRDLAAELAATERRRMRVFTCSWSDFFHPAADPWRADAWDIIRACPEYDWQILTSRPELVADRLPADWGDGWPHVWLGVTIGNRRSNPRADILRQLPAAVRFISAEPLLGPLLYDGGAPGVWRGWADGTSVEHLPQLDLMGIDWLIVGGESGGPVARRLVDADGQHRLDRLGWIRNLREACWQLDVPFFFKQWGGARPDSNGRELDGQTWSEFPASPAPLAVPA